MGVGDDVGTAGGGVVNVAVGAGIGTEGVFDVGGGGGCDDASHSRKLAAIAAASSGSSSASVPSALRRSMLGSVGREDSCSERAIARAKSSSSFDVVLDAEASVRGTAVFDAGIGPFRLKQPSHTRTGSLMLYHGRAMVLLEHL